MALRKPLLVLTTLLLLFGAACADSGTDDTEASPGGDQGDVSLEIADMPDSVEGNVVTIPVDVEGIEIVKADGDDSGDSGHFHVFIDRDPVDEGKVIPKERGVVHSADNPIKVWGLLPGEHEFTVVVGNGLHERIHEDAEDSVTVDVKGPSVRGTAPATLEEGDDLEIDLEAEGVEIKAADADDSGETGHFHILIDPASPPKAGDTIPAAEEGKIIHTPEDSATVEGLEKGEHTVWVVLGDGNHKAFDPPVMDKLTVTVG